MADTNTRAAQGILGIVLHMARTTELARRMTNARQRTLAQRLARAPDDQRLNAEHELVLARALAYEASAARIRENLPGLAVLAAAGITQEQFDRVGLGKVVQIPAPTEWEVDKEYTAGAQTIFKGTTYVCVLDHTSHRASEPPDVPAQWIVHRGAVATGDGAPWLGGVGYEAQQKVTYQGVLYACLEAHMSRGCCPPPDQPALWVRDGKVQASSSGEAESAEPVRTRRKRARKGRGKPRSKE